MLKFLSICSGIEAASVAFAPLGWEALAFAEIEPFPCAVLAHHYPQVPNLGDLTRWRTWPAALLVQVQLLCGGTPCQAFSVAGLRASLADDRGNLSFIFCELYAHINHLRRAAGLPPALLLWENVPGVLSTHDNAFGCFLAGLAGESDALQPPGGKWAHAGYVSGPSASIAYRTLDAQYFGLAQRRKRVFVVASADPSFDPATVLFEFTGLRRDTPPRRETGQTTTHDTAPCLTSSVRGVERPGDTRGQDPVVAVTAAETGSGFWTDDGLARLRVTTAPTQPQTIVADIAGTLNANGKAAGSATQQDADQGLLIPTLANCLTRRMHKGPNTTLDEGQNTTLDEGQTLLVDVTHSLRAESFDSFEDGTGLDTPLVPIPSNVVPPSSGLDESPIPFDTTQITSAANRSQPRAGDPCHPLAAGAHAPAIAFSAKDHGADATNDLAPTLRAGNHNTSHPNSGNWLAVAFPERLSGTQCARAEDLSPVLQAHNPTAVAFPVQGDGASDPVSNPTPFAFQPRIARNGRGSTGDLVNALQAQSGQTGKGEAAPCVAVQEAVGFKPRHYRHPRKDGAASPISGPLTSNTQFAGDCSPHVAYTLHGTREGTREVATPTDAAGTIREGTGSAIQNSSNTIVTQPLASYLETTANNSQPSSTIANAPPALWRVRRLVCEECELLQGFPIGYTLLPSKSGRLRKGTDLAETIAYLVALGFDKQTATLCAHSPDGPRYKALGNSWAVPCARWIGQRIAQHLAQ
jgi:DNA (cytosine-5)-methyltransferase 1